MTQSLGFCHQAVPSRSGPGRESMETDLLLWIGQQHNQNRAFPERVCHFAQTSQPPHLFTLA